MTEKNLKKETDEVTVTLTRSEALVLFDFCSRFSDQGNLSIEDQAEQRALWNLQALLQRLLPELFLPDYRERVASAKDQLRDEHEP